MAGMKILGITTAATILLLSMDLVSPFTGTSSDEQSGPTQITTKKPQSTKIAGGYSATKPGVGALSSSPVYHTLSTSDRGNPAPPPVFFGNSFSTTSNNNNNPYANQYSSYNYGPYRHQNNQYQPANQYYQPYRYNRPYQPSHQYQPYQNNNGWY